MTFIVYVDHAIVILITYDMYEMGSHGLKLDHSQEVVTFVDVLRVFLGLVTAVASIRFMHTVSNVVCF